MDRIKRLSMEILNAHKGEFGTDFVENKKVLDSVSIVRSKGLKNELAGFITKFIKREIREKQEKEQQNAKAEKSNSQQIEEIQSEESQENTETVAETTEEPIKEESDKAD